MKTIKTYWKFILYYAIIAVALVLNIISKEYSAIPYILTVLVVTIGWNLDYAVLEKTSDKVISLRNMKLEDKNKFLRVLDIEKIRYSNLYSQNQILLKENDELKLTLHNLTEERASLKKQVIASKRKSNNTRKKQWENTQTSRSEKK